jgi:hypothetical protein
MRPTVLLLLLLCGCKDAVRADFDQARALYQLIHVSGSDH